MKERNVADADADADTRCFLFLYPLSLLYLDSERM